MSKKPKGIRPKPIQKQPDWDTYIKYFPEYEKYKKLNPEPLSRTTREAIEFFKKFIDQIEGIKPFRVGDYITRIIPFRNKNIGIVEKVRRSRLTAEGYVYEILWITPVGTGDLRSVNMPHKDFRMAQLQFPWDDGNIPVIKGYRF